MWNLLGTPVILSLFLSIVAAVILFYKRRYNYWTSKGVVQLPVKFFYGNEDLKKSAIIRFMEHYQKFKDAGVRYGGIYIFSTPTLVPLDLELIKSIMVKDFDHFVDRQTDLPVDDDPLARHLFFMAGEEWRALRIKLTPTFTSGKMKMMYHTFLENTKTLEDMVNVHAANNTPADIKEISGRFTTDIIGSCAFGLDCNSMKDTDSDFRKYGKRIFEPKFVDMAKLILRNIVPKRVATLLKLKITDSEVETFFLKLVKGIVDYREKEHVSRKDFMHLLLQLRNRGALNDDGKITDDGKSGKSLMTLEEIAAQCFLFFAAGFETSSTVMTFAFFEMARNQEVQSKLRKEIEAVMKKHDNELTYECISEMKYLDCVLQESMRKYPPVPMLERECTKEYRIPGSNLVLEKGIKVGIPVIGIHMDKDYFPDPEKFDPERFNEVNRVKIPHFAHLPFGEGPRNCIGSRFGLLQSKVGVATIIRNYQLTVNEKTKFPFDYELITLVPAVIGGVWLNVKKLQ